MSPPTLPDRRSGSYLRAPIGWREVLTRTLKEIGDDNCAGLAAQLAFYCLLALFPALLFLVALVGYLPVENALDVWLTVIASVAPPELVALVRDQISQLVAGSHASLLTLGILGAIWSSSAAMVAIIDALNQAYDVAEWRPWWKRRLLAILLTIALALFTLVSLTLILVGPDVASWAAAWLRLAPVVPIVWAVARWPVLIACAVLALDLVYYFAPSRPARWAWVTPGALVATLLWVTTSFAFKFYVTNFGAYAATYGAIGGAIVAMLWFSVSGLAILAGAELNGVIEDAWRSAP